MDRIFQVLPRGLIVAVVTLAIAIGRAGTLSANDATAWPGPAQPIERVPSVGSSVADSLMEMPVAETSQDRSQQLEQVAQQADRKTRHGFELAGRRAYFAARSEFIGALRLVAEGLDTEQKTDVHGRALAAALVALKEAEDFLPGGSRLEADLDLAGIVAAHTTPVLKDETGKTTPMTALRRYLTFAQQQFAVSAGREVAGSMALHAIGKLHVALAQKKSTPIAAPESKAMVFYQAALLVYPKNYMAANDLAVLFGQCGHWADARAMLEHSLSLCPQSTGWQNLAAVYRQLGQPALAQQATEQARLLAQRDLARRQTSSAAANETVRWVDPMAFAQTSTNTPNSAGATASLQMAKPQAAFGRAAKPQATARPASDGYEPAPTPAAAQRRSWGAPTYER